MKVVALNTFKLVVMIFAAMLFSCFVNLGCRTAMPSVMAKPSPVFEKQSLTFYPKPALGYRQIDTSRRRRRELFDEQFLARADKAFSTVSSNDELLRMNLEWQKRYMRIADSARSRKYGKDSLYVLLITMRDSMAVADKKAETFYIKAQKANFYASQFDKSVKTDNTLFWVAVGIFGLSIIGTNILNYIFYKGSKKTHLT